jgi:hypothetical protein
MKDQLPESRRYTEEEVGLILRRATEMQQAEPERTDPAGLTLAELQDIAAEAGIDPEKLRQAASELQTFRPETVGNRLAGAPMATEIERVVEGELPRERLEELVPTIQTATAGQGTASEVGRSLTWTSRTGSSVIERQVFVTARDGHTIVRVQESFGGLAASLFGGIMGGVGGGVGFGLGGALSATLGLGAGLIALPIATLAGSYLLARAIYTSQVRGREVVVRALVDSLAEQVEAAVAWDDTALEPGNRDALNP